MLAGAKGHASEALAIARSVFARTFQANATPEQLADARQKLAGLIGG